MTRARRDGLYLLFIGSVIFVLLGTALEYASSVEMVDFRTMYFSTRCLVQHCDPYNESELVRISQAEGGERLWDTASVRHVMQFIYLPTIFSFTAPFAALPWGPAHILWMTLTMGSFILASFLIWNLTADFAPTLAGVLIGFLLANSELFVITGNMAGIAISLCVTAVWCLLRERFVLAGMLCLAISLAVKPQDSGLIWLYFLLAGGVYRKRALQTLLMAVVLSLPGVLWVWYVAPHWFQEWRTNVLALSVHGGMNDPGPASAGAHGIGKMISLQTVFSVFWDDPRIYNQLSYLVCAPLLLLWAFVTMRSRPSQKKVWSALAAIAALSMLPVYHRQVDTKLLLLTIPACAMLWAEGGRIGRLALLVTSAGLLLTGEIPWVIVLSLIGNLHLPATELSRQISMAVQLFPLPLFLLVVGVFSLWVYLRACSDIAPHGSVLEPLDSHGSS